MHEDADFIKMDLDSLLNDGDITEESIENIKQSIDNLVSDYEEQIDDLKGECSTLEDEKQDLENELDEKQGYGSVEELASAMLLAFAGYDPNMGEVLSLKEDLEKLLTTKYHISLGNL